LATPVNDIAIVKDDRVLPPGEVGEVWLKGPNVMQCYWNDPGMEDEISQLSSIRWLMDGLID
jgi:acyl-CoA synthetase (AMP-forming)/AMP-acid ligase II